MIKSINIENIELYKIANIMNEIEIHSNLRHPHII